MTIVKSEAITIVLDGLFLEPADLGFGQVPPPA